MPKQYRTKIREIFTSIQGEGPYVGFLHTFVRFSKCNLNCSYCDTDFKDNSKEYSTFELYEILKKEPSETISFTGGEPLLEANFLYEFLKEYKLKLNKKIYLETNGTMPTNLSKIINFVDIIAMDIKIKSATKEENQFKVNDEFLNVILNAQDKKEVFIKVVFDENIVEYDDIIKLAKKYNAAIILQPKEPIEKNINLFEIYNKFYQKYKNIRLIPQTHKYMYLK